MEQATSKPSPPAWGKRVRLPSTNRPAHVPERGWKMGCCDHCGEGDRESPRPVRKTLSRTLICPLCYAYKHQPEAS